MQGLYAGLTLVSHKHHMIHHSSQLVLRTILLVACYGTGTLAQGIWDITVVVTSPNPILPLDTSTVTAQSLGLSFLDTEILSGNCPAGFYCDGIGGVTACPANTYRDTPGADAAEACATCPVYEVSNTSVPITCAPCAAGAYLATSTDDGKGDPIGDAQRRCVQCPAGSMSPENSTTCYACGPGTYSTGGQASCSPCPAGTYSDVVGASVCSPCPEGMYTYSTAMEDFATVYTPVTGMQHDSQCITSPLEPIYGLVCLPGTYRLDASCYPCPKGYYCPMMSYLDTHASVRSCPTGTYSPGLFAATPAACSSKLSPLLYEYHTCPISTGSEADALSGLVVQAITAPRASAASVFLATATRIYRLILQDLVLQQITTGTSTPTSITAIGVDQDYSKGEAHLLVAADYSAVTGASTVFSTNLDTMEVTQLGLATKAGGIALRSRLVSGPGYAVQRLAYVSDTGSHCIRVYDIDAAKQLSLAAGREHESGRYAVAATSGSAARFASPADIAFIEDDMSNGRYLLIADSGNGVIRMLDTASSTQHVSTWFAPTDKYALEMRQPVGLYVSINSNNDLVVYVIDTGFTPSRLLALTKPTAGDLVLLTVLDTSQVSDLSAMFVPGPQLLRVIDGQGALGVGVKDMVYVNTQGAVKCFLESNLASQSINEAGDSCVYPSHAANATLQSLCGNMYLDDGEECDTGNILGTGCFPETCKINTTGWACAGNAERCLSPCVAYLHVVSVPEYVHGVHLMWVVLC